MLPVPVTRRNQTERVRAADVPIAAELIIVPLAALAVRRNAVASLRGLVLFVLVRVKFVSAQLLFVPPVVANVSLKFKRFVAAPSIKSPLAASVVASHSKRASFIAALAT